MLKRFVHALSLGGFLMLSTAAFATAGRAFVATTGDDANTSTNCGPTAPCRTFNAALSVTASGGEVIVLNSGGYGPAPVNITQSVSIVAPPGVYAGITVGSGSYGVTIGTAGVNVVLKGLTINSLLPASGIWMSNGASLTIEDCAISNSSDAPSVYGLVVATPAMVQVTDTQFQGNAVGMLFSSGATVNILRSQVIGNWAEGGAGIRAQVNDASPATTMTITESLVSRNFIGVEANPYTSSAKAKASIIRSTISYNDYGVMSLSQGGGAAAVSVSDSLLDSNAFYGLFQEITGAGTATLTSYGNNTFSNNGVDEGGTITALTTK
jgi:hypothetical protein